MDPLTIKIEAGKGYEVLVGPGLLQRCGDIAASLIEPGRLAVITDRTVAELYLDPVVSSFRGAGFGVCTFSFPAGEGSKNIETFSGILEFLAKERLTRSDCLAALGGGVVGDLAGFAAGCYLRGVRFLQLPTTLLAAVDSSVGGKTAINLGAGKNLAGLFLQPAAVLCDTDSIAALPPAVLADGLAEAIKTGILSGERLFSLLEEGGAADRLPEIIALSVRFKGDIVKADEFEAGPRRLLNLGHTVGHAIEKCSGYRITHGRAVAAGIAVITRAAARLKFCSAHTAARIERVLLQNGLPVTTPFPAGELAAAALSDKKRDGQKITLVLPRKIGDCSFWTVEVAGLRSLIEAGLEVVR